MPELKEFEEGTVAITAKNDIVVVTEIRTSNPQNPIIYTNGERNYRSSADFFTAVVGVVDVSKLKEAKQEAHRELNEVANILRGLKAGDRIVMKDRGSLQVVSYDCLNPKCRKNPISFTLLDGRGYKGPLSLFVRVATPEDIASANPLNGKL